MASLGLCLAHRPQNHQSRFTQFQTSTSVNLDLQYKQASIIMTPAGFVKVLIMKFESGLQNAMPRRHGSVASRPNDPNSRRRSAPPRTVSISGLESPDVNVLQNDTSATDSEDRNETEGYREIRTDGDNPQLGFGTRPANEIVTEAGGSDRMYVSSFTPSYSITY
jgi:hypothetical protein